MNNQWRVLGPSASSGFCQMAEDHAILEAVAGGCSPPTIRFYSFSPPCLSIGRFQEAGDVRLEECRRLGIDVVRRPTGGRSLLHKDDFTYMVVLPLSKDVPRSVEGSYKMICRGIIRAMRDLGVDAEMVSRPRKAGKDERACFAIPASADLAVFGKKLCGSAQVRLRGALLQHGSIMMKKNTTLLFSLLSHSGSDREERERAYEESCVCLEELGLSLRWEEMEESVVQGFSTEFGVEIVPGVLSEQEERRIEYLVDVYSKSVNGGSKLSSAAFVGMIE